MGRLLAVLAFLVALAALPTVAAAQDAAPVIASASVSPAGLPYTGGTVTITAHASDDVGIATVYAEYSTSSSGNFGAVPLIASGPDQYSATFAIAANFTDNEDSYQFTIRA